LHFVEFFVLWCCVCHGGLNLCPNEKCDMQLALKNTGHWDANNNSPRAALIMFELIGCPFCQCTRGALDFITVVPEYDTFHITDIGFYYIPWDFEGPPTDEYACGLHPDCVQKAQKLQLNTTVMSFPTLTYFTNDTIPKRMDVSNWGCAIDVRAICPPDCGPQNKTTLQACEPVATPGSEYICNLAANHPEPDLYSCTKGPYCKKSKPLL